MKSRLIKQKQVFLRQSVNRKTIVSIWIKYIYIFLTEVMAVQMRFMFRFLLFWCCFITRHWLLESLLRITKTTNRNLLRVLSNRLDGLLMKLMKLSNFDKNSKHFCHNVEMGYLIQCFRVNRPKNSVRKIFDLPRAQGLDFILTGSYRRVSAEKKIQR